MNATHNSSRILVVDDEPDLRTLYELTLLREGHTVESAEGVADAWQALESNTYDLVITDMRLPDGTGLDLLKRLGQAKRDEVVMVITAYGSAQSAVEALRTGAYDYLTKPVDLKQFRQSVSVALASRPKPSNLLFQANLGATTAPPDQTVVPQPAPALSRLIGHSPAMVQVRALIEKVAASMAPVRLWGESGTGKELVAKAIHDVSARSANPFVAVNCGAIPEHLMEAEFFGYRKGAFTGANEDRAGFFQAAQGGTLFLDEIGDLPLLMQTKLLRVIQERAVRRLGDAHELPCNVRIISASHKDLEKEVIQGNFRQDLFFRINVILISLPPLRERLMDLPLVAEQLLEKIAQDTHLPHKPQLSIQALRALQAHPFVGNVRELENILHRAVALSNSAFIAPHDLGIPQASMFPASDQSINEKISEADQVAHSTPAPATTELPSDLTTYLDEIEKTILVRALETHQLNRTAAASSLGLSLRQMRYRMARLNLQINAAGVSEAASANKAIADLNIPSTHDEYQKSLPWQAGWWQKAKHCSSPNFGPRPLQTIIDLVVIHSISLPPGQYGGNHIEQLFTNQLDAKEHPYFESIEGLKVSSHFLIRRDGATEQYVSVLNRAWHAGDSQWLGRKNCNDNSVGIELEGLEGENFEPIQYFALANLLRSLCQYLPIKHIAGHEHVSPGRKFDPGTGFNWALMKASVADLPLTWP